MAKFTFTLNGAPATVDIDPSTPLLWVLRDHLGLTGTKFGCGAAQCGACTVHVDGEAVRSCVYTIDSVEGAAVTTIEGLSKDGLHRLQKAWIEHQVPQCGYCQPGFIMAAAALIAQQPKPSDADIEASITNICRCGTYARIKQAIRSAVMP
ncbi:MAG: (2Fe-2S)-binding protein [Hyphomicrobiales bacterium]|nr:(2Fe-2S)-binding protein [Hyphomicrobiales bacterium]MBV8823599.1 (2Fe-2S)-binding protein [Hyphomicrobiales bacterium]MBV9429757.1 (2Fe-2S)-binding protein [Bradyrhizobiaceae bacterium]